MIESGLIFGHLTILESGHRIGVKKYLAVKCKCVCGNILIVNESSLKSGASKSCGCLKKKHKDIEVGDCFSKLTVLEIGHSLNNKSAVKCKCVCGSMNLYNNSLLKSGNTKSCGCERSKGINNPSYKHGLAGTKEYNTWCHIKSRCYNKNNKRYSDYGGRGIAMQEDFINDFSLFLKEVGYAPSKTHSLDRKDNNKGYIKGNMRWVTSIEQNNNKRSNIIITYNGITKSFKSLCEDYNINYEKSYQRFHTLKWDINRIFSSI